MVESCEMQKRPIEAQLNTVKKIMNAKKPTSSGSAARLGANHQRFNVVETINNEIKGSKIENYEIQRPITQQMGRRRNKATIEEHLGLSGDRKDNEVKYSNSP